MGAGEVGVVGKTWFGRSSVVACGVTGVGSTEKKHRPAYRMVAPSREMSLAFPESLPFLEVFRPAVLRAGCSHHRM